MVIFSGGENWKKKFSRVTYHIFGKKIIIKILISRTVHSYDRNIIYKFEGAKAILKVTLLKRMFLVK